jgi:hypothetical protein
MGRKARTIAVGVLIIGAASAAAGFYYRDDIRRQFEPWQLTVCEQIITAGLKAPATYRRVDVLGTGGDILIKFDAANSYGTPIRGVGHCIVPNSVNALLEETTTASVDGRDIDPLAVQTETMKYWSRYHTY